MIIDLDLTLKPEDVRSPKKSREREPFLTRNFTDYEMTDRETRETTQSTFVTRADIPEAANAHFHRNFLENLTICYANHYGAVLRPEVLWFDLLCELALLIKEKPEQFRTLFTDLPEGEKGLIVIETPEIDDMPLDLLVERLKGIVPMDATSFFPEFSTSGKASRFAMYAAFADMASPFYDYFTMLCGIPRIMLAGAPEDWRKVAQHWRAVCEILQIKGEEWPTEVESILDSIAATATPAGIHAFPDFWKEIIAVERCGSGHEVTVDGWYSRLYRERPLLAKQENFSSHIASVEYTNITVGRKFTMSHGVFFSMLDENKFFSPCFGSVVVEHREVEHGKAPPPTPRSHNLDVKPKLVEKPPGFTTSMPMGQTVVDT